MLYRFLFSGINLQLSTATYVGSRSIVRNSMDIYPFNVELSSGTQELYKVVQVDKGERNYDVLYFYEEEPIVNGSHLTNQSGLIAISDTLDTGKGLTPGHTLFFSINITEGMDFPECDAVQYICLLLRNSHRASFVESNMEDNVHCVDISQVKDCRPGIIKAIHRGPLLLTWLNFNPSMDE